MEKPFGRDSESFRQLSADLYEHLTEDQMYRIDHYLGKELIENLTVRCLCGRSAAALHVGTYSLCWPAWLHPDTLHCLGLFHSRSSE